MTVWDKSQIEFFTGQALDYPNIRGEILGPFCFSFVTFGCELREGITVDLLWKIDKALHGPPLASVVLVVFESRCGVGREDASESSEQSDSNF